MLARTQNASQRVLTKPFICQREHKMYLNSCWLNPSHDREDTNVSQHVMIKHIQCKRGHKKVTQHVLAKSTSNQRGHKMNLNMLTKFIQCQRRQKLHLNMCWPNQSYASEHSNSISTCDDENLPCQRGQLINHIMCLLNSSHASVYPKYISTHVDQAPPISARTLNVPQLVLNKPKQCQREHKMHLNMCWPNPSHTSEDTRCISKLIQCQRGH